jgi:D-inositol-3-phosphate glycosyltransferase
MTPDSLRIALISEHASPLASLGGVDAGGQNTYVDQVARALARRGHAVDMLTRRDSPDLPPVVDLQPGVRVLHIEAGPAAFVPKEQLLEHMPEFARRATRLLATDDPREACDLLHANFFMSGLVGLRLARAFSLPLAVTFHALGLVRREHHGSADTFPPERIDIERTLVQQADALIAECPQDRADLMRLYGARPSRISTVPCGVDTHLFAPGDKAQARRALGWSDDEFIILQLGRLVPRKGIDNVILALARLPRSIKARLVVVGGDSPVPDEHATPEIARLRAIAQEAGVGDRVSFTGQRARHELPRYYIGADVFVTTPWYEPFGITPLEAMACGTPVIGSAVGGIRHTVAPGVSGCLVPPRDPDALAEQLQRLQAHPQVARALGRGGVQRVRTLFTWDRVATELLAVYRALAPAARPQRRLQQAAALASMRAGALPVAAAPLSAPLGSPPVGPSLGSPLGSSPGAPIAGTLATPAGAAARLAP